MSMNILTTPTYCIHALTIERNHSVGRISHKNTLIKQMIRGALHRDHGLSRQPEEILFETLTVKTQTHKHSADNMHI